MRKLGLLLLFLAFTASNALAQPSKIKSAEEALKNGKLKKAKNQIDDAVNHSKTKDNAKAWLVRGEVYRKIGQNKDSDRLKSNPLEVSLKSLKKCKELDVGNDYERPYIQNLSYLGVALFNKAARTYKAADEGDQSAYKFALNSFENYFKALERLGTYSLNVENTLQQNDVDPNIVYLYAGNSAFRLNKFNKAKGYYQEIINLQLEIPAAYLKLAEIHNKQGNFDKAVSVIKTGKKVMPDNDDIITKEIQLYKDAGKVDELVTKLENEIGENSENKDLMLVLASSYENLAEVYRKEGKTKKANNFFDKSANMYKRVIEIDPDHFNTNRNLGALYFNRARRVMKKMNKIDDRSTSKYRNLKSKRDNLFKSGKPYFEKALELKGNEAPRSVLEGLKTIYDFLGQDQKLKEIKAKLN